jgi:hypothetical protein
MAALSIGTQVFDSPTTIHCFVCFALSRAGPNRQWDDCLIFPYPCYRVLASCQMWPDALKCDLSPLRLPNQSDGLMQATPRPSGEAAGYQFRITRSRVPNQFDGVSFSFPSPSALDPVSFPGPLFCPFTWHGRVVRAAITQPFRAQWIGLGNICMYPKKLMLLDST